MTILWFYDFWTCHCSRIRTWKAVTENIWSLHSVLLDWGNAFPVCILSSGVNWKPPFACRLVRCLILHMQSEIYNFTARVANIHRSKASGKKSKPQNLTVFIQNNLEHWKIYAELEIEKTFILKPDFYWLLFCVLYILY